MSRVNVVDCQLCFDGLLFYVIFKSISVISETWEGAYKKLCDMEPRLQLERYPPPAGLEPDNARSAGNA